MPPTSQAVAANPLWGKALSAVIGAAAAGAVLYAFRAFGQSPITIAIMVGGLLAVVLLLILYRLLLGWLQRRKAAPMTRSILANSSTAPHGIADPAKRAKLDEMRKSFETGVTKFKAAGKDLYTLPWFVLVGEPGGGKTEAIRHSQVGFPHGLQDYMQGAGGTVNMNWWFTNHAIILDTAGRLMFEEVAPGATNEWTEFLALLRQHRPNCPINGMVLVIPADSLIKDSTEAIERKAGKIAQQLDLIQRTLEVRFPVFVIISKCDLVSGFREFFETVDDPQLQGQILGWSNPMSLDQPFNPEAVDKHLETVRERLSQRRYGLLIDPVNTQDPSARRIDEVDALYTFPDALARIGPRLRRYLEMIFVAGEWSPKPLFLRGIYFTSSMREGAALDAELAEVLKVPVDSLQDEGRAWERNKTFFLREPFLKKIFAEKGLVTRASRPNRLHRARKVAVLGFGFAAVVALAVATYLGDRQFEKGLGPESKFWPQVSSRYATGEWQVITPDGFFNRGPLPGVDNSLNRIFKEAPKRYDREIQIPRVFRAADQVVDRFSPERRKEAYRALYERTVLQPLLARVRAALPQLPADSPRWPEATAALKEMIRLEAAAASQSPPSSPPVQLDPLFRFALSESDTYPDYERAKETEGDLAVAAEWLYSDRGAAWPPPSLALNTQDSQENLKKAIAAFKAHWQHEVNKRDEALARADKLKEELDAYEAQRKRMDAAVQQGVKPPITTTALYAAMVKVLDEQSRRLAEVRTAVDAKLREAFPNAVESIASIEKAYLDAQNRRNAEAQAAFADLKQVAGRTDVREWLGTAPQRPADAASAETLEALRVYLAPVEGMGVPRYRLSEEVYDRALKELVAARDDRSTAARADELTRVLGAIDEGAAEKAAAVDAAKPQLAAVGVVEAARAWEVAVDAAASYRRYVAIQNVVNQFGEAALKEHVARLAAQRAQPHPATVPFTSLNQGETFLPAFDPQTAKAVLHSLRQLQLLFPDSVGQPAGNQKLRVLDYDALLKRYATVKNRSGQYLEEYVDYWYREAPRLAAFRDDQLRSWADFFVKAKGLTANTINNGLSRLLAQIDGALQVVDESGDVKAMVQAAKARDEFNAYRAAMQGGPFTRTSNTVLQNWLRSNGVAKDARRAILELRPDDIDTYVFDVRDAGFVSRYWMELTGTLLEALAAASEAELQQGYGAFSARYDAFPLTMTDARPALTAEQLKAARAAFDQLFDQRAAREPVGARGTIGAGNLPANFDRVEALKRLINPQEALPRVARLRQIFAAIDPNDPATFTVLLPDTKRRAAAAKRPVKGAEVRWRDLRLFEGNVMRGEINNDPGANPVELARSIKVRGDLPVRIDLGKGAVGANQATTPVVLAAPCPGLRLLFGPQVKTAQPRQPRRREDGGVEHEWDVEIEVADKDANNEKFSLWLVVVFDRELPHPNEWAQGLRMAGQ